MFTAKITIDGFPFDEVKADVEAATAILSAEQDKYLRTNDAFNDAKKAALISCSQLIEMERSRNDQPFPRDSSEYTFLVTNRGRTSRRSKDNVETWSPLLMRVPWQFRWITDVGADQNAIKEATVFAYNELRRRAPVVTRTYRNSIHIYVNDVPSSHTSFLARNITPSDIIYVSAQPARKDTNFGYANAVELGYYSGRYRVHPELVKARGVVRPIAKMLRKKFGDRISARFSYRVNMATLGTFPVIEIGFQDQILQRDSIPGLSDKRRRTIRRR